MNLKTYKPFGSLSPVFLEPPCKTWTPENLYTYVRPPVPRNLTFSTWARCTARNEGTYLSEKARSPAPNPAVFVAPAAGGLRRFSLANLVACDWRSSSPGSGETRRIHRRPNSWPRDTWYKDLIPPEYSVCGLSDKFFNVLSAGMRVDSSGQNERQE